MADPRIPGFKFELHYRELQRLSSSRLEVARLVLVEGVSRTEAAERVGMTKQGVQQALKKVLEVVMKPESGWVEVHTLAPAELAEEFLAKVAAHTDESEGAKSISTPRRGQGSGGGRP